jgi:CRP-like cAMP-binding protein
MLEEIIPFRYLSPAERESLRADVDEVVFEPNAVLIEKGAVSREVFLILEGSVLVVDPDDPRPGQSQTVVSGNYIGERAALFDEPRALEVRTVDPVRALVIPGDRFLTLIHESTPFAQALGNILRDKQGIFRPFDRFLVALLDTSAGGSVDLQTLLPHYERLRPALHSGVSETHEVDAGALSYAIRRLPENLTGTLAYYVTDTLPALFAAPARHFDPVPTAARRRAVYEMMPGKSMVLVRDGISDLLDFICCLCLFAIEARKLRR